MAQKNCKNFQNITLKNSVISDKTGSAKLFVTSNKVSSSINQINIDEVDFTQKKELAVSKELTISTQTLDSLSITQNILILKLTHKAMNITY